RAFRGQSLAVVDHAADALAAVHQIEGLIDALERHGVGDELIELDAAAHCPVDVLGQLRAPARAAEGGAAPGASGDEQERPHVDLLAGAGDADDDALSPTLVTGHQRLVHHLDVADAL